MTKAIRSTIFTRHRLLGIKLSGQSGEEGEVGRLAMLQDRVRSQSSVSNTSHQRIAVLANQLTCTSDEHLVTGNCRLAGDVHLRCGMPNTSRQKLAEAGFRKVETFQPTTDKRPCKRR